MTKQLTTWLTMALLASARGTRVRRKTYPPQRDISDEPPRVGVFVCQGPCDFTARRSTRRIVAAQGCVGEGNTSSRRE